MEKNRIFVVAGVFEVDGKYLIARRKLTKSLAGKWEFPGGKIEVGESHPNALARELKEEFGSDFSIGAFIGDSLYSYPTFEVHLFAYRVFCNETRLESCDHDAIAWADKKNLRSYDMAAADLPIIDLL